MSRRKQTLTETGVDGCLSRCDDGSDDVDVNVDVDDADDDNRETTSAA